MPNRLYEPLQTLKPIADNIWIADGPAACFYGVDFPTRMTVIRLPDGRLWLHSPIAMTPSLCAEIEALGSVAFLIAPNNIHYLSVAAWKAHYPETTVWAAPKVADRARQYGYELTVDQVLGDTPPDDWAAVLDQVYVRGNRMLHEVDFFHRPSRTLILTDLIENFEPQKMPWYLRPLIWLAGNGEPDGKAPIDMRLAFRGGEGQARTAVEKMLAWQPERIILAHGRCYERDGTAELKRAFRWLLDAG